MFFDDLKSSKFLEKTKRVAFLFDTQIRNLQLKKKITIVNMVAYICHHLFDNHVD